MGWRGGHHSPRSATSLSRFLDQEVFLSRICHMYTHAQMVLGHALIWVLFYRLASGYKTARYMAACAREARRA